MKVKVFNGIDEFAAGEGTKLGPTEWLAVTQDRVNQFADATDDHQWIHVEPQRAADGLFGGTIAHGLLTLSLLPRFMHELYRVDSVAMAFVTTVEVDGSEKPAAVVESIIRYVA